jgi:acyl transferase domain-containing protein
VLVLKKLADATVDRDHIYAVIKGTATNNDGLRKVGYTAPSVEGQAQVIKAAQLTAEVEPESISYIEAHGTATPLGDTVEIEALKQAFNTDKREFCAIGTVKSNVGHLYSAAKEEKPEVIFMFCGQGSQYVNMGIDLYRTEPIFREEMDQCFEILNGLVDYNIKEILYLEDSVSKVSRGSSDDSARLPGTGKSPLERGTPDPRKGGVCPKSTKLKSPSRWYLLLNFRWQDC